MKKLFATAFVLFVFYSLCSAQDESSFKASRKKISTEASLNLFSSNPSLNSVLKQVKGRYFFSDSYALRFGFAADIRTLDRETTQPYGDYAYMSKGTRKANTFTLNMGAERHFKGTSRLSPYIGVDLCFSSKSASEKGETDEFIYDVKNGWREVQYSGNYVYYTFNERAYNSLGLNILLGVDFYVSKNFYIGYELVPLGVQFISYKQVEDNSRRKSSAPTQEPKPNNNDKDFSFGSSFNNSIRVGFVF